MRLKWIMPSILALLVLMLAIVMVQGGSLAKGVQADLLVTKTIDIPVIAPGQTVIYTVTLSNTTGAAIEVTSLVDTLPTGFEYMGLAPVPGVDCQNKNASSVTLPTVQWTGPITVSASGAFTLCYSVYVPASTPLSATPYTNTVVAMVGASSYQAEEGVMVAIGQVSMDKKADRTRVMSGESVTYTVTFNNSGYVTVPLSLLEDTLPTGVTFVGMTASSDVATVPFGLTDIITWSGPFTIPSHGELVFEYEAAVPVTSDTLHLENLASGKLGDGTLLTASDMVEVSDALTQTVRLPIIYRAYSPANFLAVKTANPTVVYNDAPGGLVTYQVVFTNKGSIPGVLADIRDTLPAGFSFVQMMAGSDVMAAPSGTSGQIVWTGPFTVNADSSLKLIYQARATTILGTYVNSVTATVSKGLPFENPASAEVSVEEAFLLVEEFEKPSQYWEPFLNYWRLNDQQWHYVDGISDDGSRALRHTYYLGVSDPERGAHDALFTYQEPGSENWGDYSYESRVFLGAGEQIGLWFRGTAIEDPDLGGRYVTGYYLVLVPGGDSKMRVVLLQMRTDDECGDDCAFNYHFSNPIELVEMQGVEDLGPLNLSIKDNTWYWMRVDAEGTRLRCYVNNTLVIDYNDTVGTAFTQGSVGFFVYKAADARFDHVTVKPLR